MIEVQWLTRPKPRSLPLLSGWWSKGQTHRLEFNIAAFNGLKHFVYDHFMLNFFKYFKEISLHYISNEIMNETCSNTMCTTRKILLIDSPDETILYMKQSSANDKN